MKPRLCVLLVEDDAIDAKLLVRELGRGGYDLTIERVETATAMAEALDRTAWDVVVADHCRATFGADAALDVVKQRGLDIPFIVVSDTIGQESAVTAPRASASDFMTKNRLAGLRPAIEREIREARVRRTHSKAPISPGDTDEYYRIVAEGASDAILITDEDGAIVYANPATRQIFGFTSDQLIGQPFTTLARDRLEPSRRDRLARELRPTNANRLSRRVELIGRHITGALLWLDASIGSAMHDGRRVSICILRDVSARHREEVRRARRHAAAKRARRAAEERYQQADQANRAKAEFLAMLSHELRTPLSTIIGYTELLDRNQNEPLTLTQQSYVARIVANGNRLVTLIDEVLTFSAIEAGKTRYNITDAPLASLVVAVADTVAPSAQKQGVTVTLAPHDPALSVRADPDKLQQVLSNVVGNAIKFTAPRGRIDVSCEESADVVRIRVRDTGCGMPTDQLDTIFHPFVQLDNALARKYGGVGLGLAISKKFVDDMNGSIEVDSALGVGTTFAIILPRGDRLAE